MVLIGIAVGGCIDIHILPRGTVTVVGYGDGIFSQYVHL